MSTINVGGSSKISVDKASTTRAASSSQGEGTQRTSTRSAIVNHVDIFK